MNPNNRILITGGAGFIGSHLVNRLLSLGLQITCLDSFDPFYGRDVKQRNIEEALSDKRFKLIVGDIRNRENLEACFESNDIDCVIHLAAKAGVRQSLIDPIECYNVNVIGTLNLLETMRSHEVKKMIFASSSSVYGNNPKSRFTEIDNVDLPVSPYAASKKAGELLCHTFYHLYNFDIFCLRFFTVYGPRQRPDLAIHKFTNRILNDEPIEIYGDGNSYRDYTYIDDITDGIIKSCQKLSGYEVINLGGGNPVTLNSMVDTIERLLNKTSKKVHLPFQAGDVNCTYSDITKAQKLLGYLPTTIFEDGMANFIKWKLK